jgi:hypothetical protein
MRTRRQGALLCARDALVDALKTLTGKRQEPFTYGSWPSEPFRQP